MAGWGLIPPDQGFSRSTLGLAPKLICHAPDYRYDKDSGNMIRVRDMAENEILLSYNKTGDLERVEKRGADDVNAAPAARFEYNKDGQLAAVYRLGEFEGLRAFAWMKKMTKHDAVFVKCGIFILSALMMRGEGVFGGEDDYGAARPKSAHFKVLLDPNYYNPFYPSFKWEIKQEKNIRSAFPVKLTVISGDNSDNRIKEDVFFSKMQDFSLYVFFIKNEDADRGDAYRLRVDVVASGKAIKTKLMDVAMKLPVLLKSSDRNGCLSEVLSLIRSVDQNKEKISLGPGEHIAYFGSDKNRGESAMAKNGFFLDVALTAPISSSDAAEDVQEKEYLQPWLAKNEGKWEWEWNHGACILSDTAATNEDDLTSLAEFLEVPRSKFQKPDAAEGNSEASGALPGYFQLELNHLKITDVGLARLGALLNLQGLSFSGDKITDAGLAHIGNLSRLQSLGCNAPNATGAGYGFLSKLHDLKNFASSTINDDDMTALASVISLNSVSIAENTDITDAGLAKLASLPKLNFLQLTSCSRVTGSGFAEFAKSSTLETLSLVNNSITDQGIAALSRLCNLQRLTVGKVPAVTDQGLAEITRLPKLEMLWLLGAPHITDEGIASLVDHSALTSLRIFQCEKLTDASLFAIGRLPNLLSVDIAQCGGITEDGLEKLRETLPKVWVNGRRL